jgi:hypothetical protein
MTRSILAVLAGVLVGVVVIMLVEMLGHAIFPPPDNPTMNPKVLEDYIATAPFGALIFPVLAYILGSFFGGLTAALLGRRARIFLSMVVAVVLLAFAVINLVMIRHPVWFMIITVLVFFPSAYLGALLAKPRSEPH